MAILSGIGSGLFYVPRSADPAPADSRIRVLDGDFDVRPFLDKMKSNGTLVVGRYYSREIDQRCNYEGKMLTRVEANAILSKGFGLLTVFQFCNGAGSFDGEKGKMDGQWAIDRAKMIDQPTG